MNFEHIKALALNPPDGLKEAALSQDLTGVHGAFQSIPPESKGTFMIAIAGLVFVILGLICQALWAVWGVLTLLNPASCNAFVSLVSKIVVGAKSFLVLVLIGYAAHQGKQIVEKVRGGYAPLHTNAPATGGYAPAHQGGSLRLNPLDRYNN